MKFSRQKTGTGFIKDFVKVSLTNQPEMISASRRYNSGGTTSARWKTPEMLLKSYSAQDGPHGKVHQDAGRTEAEKSY